MFPPFPSRKENVMITRESFYENVIVCPEPGVKRLVMKRDLVAAQRAVIKGDGDYIFQMELEEKIEQRMWVPTGPDDNDYNLVLSLCTDGLHRPVFDLDFERDQLQFQTDKNTRTQCRAYVTHDGSRTELRFPSGESYVFDSTNHCHLYIQRPSLFTEYLAYLEMVPGDDGYKYMSNVRRRGFGALRPPWVKKEEVLADD